MPPKKDRSQTIVVAQRRPTPTEQQLVAHTPLISQFEPKPVPTWDRNPSKVWEQITRLLEDAQLGVYFQLIDEISNQELINRIPQLQAYQAYPNELKIILHKIKQLIKIHVFQLYDTRENSVKQLGEQVGQHLMTMVKKLLSTVVISALTGDIDASLASLESFQTNMTTFVRLLKTIYLPEDIGDLDKLLDEVTENVAQVRRKKELHDNLRNASILTRQSTETELQEFELKQLQNVSNVFSTDIYVKAFKEKFEFLLKQKQRFNYSFIVNHLKETARTSDAQFKQTCDQLGIKDSSKFTELRREYLDAYQRYTATVEDTTAHIQQFIPLVQESSFDEIITAVNGYIAETIDTQTFVSGVILDLLHQRVRTPEAASAIEEKLNSVFIPVYNDFCPDSNELVRTTVQTLLGAQTVEKYAKIGEMTMRDFLKIFAENGAQPSLRRRYEHAWDQAREAMGLTAGEGQQRLFALEAAQEGWQQPAALRPSVTMTSTSTTPSKVVVIEDDDDDADIVVTTTSSTATRVDHSQENSTGTALATVVLPPLEPQAAATEQQQFAQAIAVQSKRDAFAAQFAHFSTEAHYVKGDSDHTAATQLFKNLVKQSQSIPELQALLEVAKPYVCRHKNVFWDSLSSKTDTSSWAKSMTVARRQAMALLNAEVRTMTDPRERKNYLEYQQRLDLFGYRPNGQSGSTSEGKQLSKLIAEAEAETMGRRPKGRGYS